MKKIIQITAHHSVGGVFALTEDGSMWIGTLKGLSLIWRPLEAKVELPKPPGKTVAEINAEANAEREKVKNEEKASVNKHHGSDNKNRKSADA
jgi:hypothetical protein